MSMSSDHRSTVPDEKRLRRYFSAQDLEDDACAYSSEGDESLKSFREVNAEQNRIYPMDMRDFRRLVDLPIPNWRAKLGGPRRRVDPVPVVYFIQAFSGGPIKIGVSTLGALIKRLNSLQVGNPLDLYIRRLVAGDWRLERGLHSYFAEHRSRIRGEWFNPTPELEEIATPRSEWERDGKDRSANAA